MFVKVTGEVKNRYGRIIPVDTVIMVDEVRGRELIRMDLAEFVTRDIRQEYQNEIQRLKNKDDASPPQDRKRSWFGRLIGI